MTADDDDLITRRLAETLAEARAALPPPTGDVIARLRTRRSRARRRRTLLTTTAAAFLVLTVAVVAGVTVERGWSGRPGSDAVEGRDQVIRIWSLRSNGRDTALREQINDFNRRSELRIELTLLTNDDYKQQLAGVLGTPHAPDVFLNWGGGGLTELVDAGQVVDLTEAVAAHPGFAEAFLPTVLAGGRVHGRQYGLPMDGMQPSVLFYNRKVFADAGLRPPRTYPELLNLVDEFKAREIIPIALAGAQGWPQLMYLMYLTDRIGGPGKFADILAGKPDAWSDPAVLQAVTLSQELAARGAFGSGFSGIGYDSDIPSQRLAAGEAAMHLMGAWEYGNLRIVDADFARDDLGWVPFPAVPGGAGDARNVVGAPANYFSVLTASAHVDVVVDFLLQVLLSDRYLDGLQAAGEVPGVTRPPAGSADGFTTFVYQLAAQAPSFTLAWDQALSPTAGGFLNHNLGKLFRSELTPEQFVADMAQTR